MEQLIVTSDNSEVMAQFEQELTNIYIESFANEPYCEKFTPIDVHNIIQSWLYSKDGFSILFLIDSVVVGFIAGYNLTEERKIDRIIRYDYSVTEDRDNVFYIADLCVNIRYRKKGYATELIKSLITKNISFDKFIARTNCRNQKSKKAFINNGFKLLSHVEQLVALERVNEEEKQDKRIFLYYNRSI